MKNYFAIRDGSCAMTTMLLLTFSLQPICAIDMTVAAVFEKDYTLAKHVVNKMFEWTLKREFPDDNFEYIGITLEENESEQSVCEKLVSKNPMVVIDTTRQPLRNLVGTLVKKVTRKYGIPTVTGTYGQQNTVLGWENLNENEQEYLVQIPPPGDLISQAVRDIVTNLNMTTTGVLFDKNIEMDGKYAILLQNIPTRASILLVESNRQSIREQALKMRTSDTAYYFVIGSTSTINYALDVAESNNMTGREFSWFLISLERKDPSCNCRNLTALWLSPPNLGKNKEILDVMVQGIEYPSEVEVAFYYDLTRMTSMAVRTLMRNGNWPQNMAYPSCDSNIPDVNENRKDVKLRTALKELNYEGLFGKFVIKDIGGNYQELQLIMRRLYFQSGMNTNPQRLGIWTYSQPTGQMSFEPGRDLKNFTAVTVYKVTTLTMPPFIEKTIDENGNVVFSGYCVDLINEIKILQNFEYTIFETEDKVFGTMDEETGQWNGMIRDLVDKKADIALGPISVMAERETVVDFTVPYYDLVGISILMKKPSIPSSLFKFLTVLEANVWGCILAAYFFTSFLMYFFDRLSPYSYSNNKEKYANDDEDEKRDFSLKESLWFCMTSLTPQGGGEAPRNLSGRLVAATWWLFGFIIIASYTANLAAFLTVSRLDSSIESLDDLAKQYKIKYAPQDSTSAATYFSRMAYIEEKFYEIWKNMSLDDTLSETERAKLAVWDYPVSDKYTKIWWTMQETGLPKSFEEGVDLVLQSKGSQEGFAFIADATQVKYAVMTNCELISVGSEFSRKPLALAVQQGSPLKDQISSSILKLLNQRKLEGLKEKWWNKHPAKMDCDDSEQQSDGISIANIGGVFIVIFIGVVLACITLAIEYWFYKKKKPNTTRIVTVKQYPEKKQQTRRHRL